MIATRLFPWLSPSSPGSLLSPPKASGPALIQHQTHVQAQAQAQLQDSGAVTTAQIQTAPTTLTQTVTLEITEPPLLSPRLQMPLYCLYSAILCGNPHSGAEELSSRPALSAPKLSAAVPMSDQTAPTEGAST